MARSVHHTKSENLGTVDTKPHQQSIACVNPSPVGKALKLHLSGGRKRKEMQARASANRFAANVWIGKRGLFTKVPTKKKSNHFLEIQETLEILEILKIPPLERPIS